MRVVLDTNVLVSGIYFTGSPAQVLAAWAGGRFELLASVEILVEYRRVGARLGSKYASVDAQSILDLVTRESRIVDPFPVPVTACDDPGDLMFLGCAIAGRARCVVRGDRASSR